MKAVILAGGKGTRLRPYTTVFPKPFVPVGERPVMEIVLRQLAKHGFREVHVALGYLADIIKSYFGNGERFGVSLHYHTEESPLGTAGPLKPMAEHLTEPFLLLNGDTLTDLDYSAFLEHHIRSGDPATICIKERDVFVDFGVVEIECGHITKWMEKPTLHYLVSTGMYALSPEVLDLIPEGKFDLPELVMSLLEDGRPVGTYLHLGNWLDIGRPDDYAYACDHWQEVIGDLLEE